MNRYKKIISQILADEYFPENSIKIISLNTMKISVIHQKIDLLQIAIIL